MASSYIYIYIWQVHIYIYIYIYIILHGTVYYPGFHAFSDRWTEWRLKKKQQKKKKKQRLIWLIFLFENWGVIRVLTFVCYWLLVCLCLCYCLCIHIYVCLHMYWRASSHINPYFRCLLVGRNVTKEDCENRWMVEGKGNGLLQTEILFLSNFMVAKGLFWFEYEMFVLWGILLSDDDDWN